MILQDLVKIKKAEEDSVNIVNEAKNKRENIIKGAKEQAYKIRLDANLKAETDFNNIIEDIVSSEQGKIDELLRAGKIEVENILDLQEEELDKAVNLIIEKVVGEYGDS